MSAVHAGHEDDPRDPVRDLARDISDAPECTGITDPETGLTLRQEKAIAALLTEPTVAKAAQAAGVAERTMHVWLRREDFLTEFRRRRREAFAQAVGLAQRYTPLALQVLAKTMVDESVPHQARIAAAQGVLKFARQGIELDELEERVEKLEHAAVVSSAEAPSWR